jgi:predicted alpha/beta superfamily hydrolase
MHDGQNLFDAETSFHGEWGVDETMEQLAQEGREAIVVGVSNGDQARNDEYSPFVDRQHGGGRGDAYLAFLAETVAPLVEGEFRTAPGAENRGIMGSSLGGLISLYAFLQYPGVYGFAGVMSPAAGFAGGALLGFVAEADYVPGRLYVDFGGRELGHEWSDRLLMGAFSRRYLNTVRKLVRLLEQKGYRHGENLLYVEEAQARHEEAAWARRLPQALRFLLHQT